MILDELVLHNVGSFAGRQRLLLRPPSPQQPIVLIGAKNGAGKTTILDALQLVLYGRLARCSSRGDESYEEFLRKTTHRGVAECQGSAIELQFAVTSQGVQHTYRVHRSWTLSGNGGAKERLEVVRDGALDKALTEQWAEHVEVMLPSRLSPFFFFDGEKIAALADPLTAPTVLRTAMDSLLGLDVVDRLRADLLVLERRRKADASTTQILMSDVSNLEATILRAERDQEDAAQSLAAARNRKTRAERDLRLVEEKYESEGGPLADERRLVEREVGEIREQRGHIETQLCEVASEELPLFLLHSLLEETLVAAVLAAEGAEELRWSDALEKRDEWLVTTMSSAPGVSSSVREQLRELLRSEREARKAVVIGPFPPVLSGEDRALARLLLEHVLPERRRRAADLASQHDSLREAQNRVERQLAAVPSDEALTAIRLHLAEARALVAIENASIRQEEERYERAQRVRAAEERRLAGLLRENSEAMVQGAELERILRFSERARNRLAAFREAATAANVGRLEMLIGEAFTSLHRKKDYVQALHVDANSMTIHLAGVNGSQIDAERLSAGERQILATSILWALAKASGKALPVVIDTPLGRLDGDHRTLLVNHYFPNASHQVVLLSTDTEISSDHLESLRGSVGRRYSLVFDDASKSTRVVDGYFQTMVKA